MRFAHYGLIIKNIGLYGLSCVLSHVPDVHILHVVLFPILLAGGGGGRGMGGGMMGMMPGMMPGMMGGRALDQVLMQLLGEH